jgi:hypothetical protein
LVTGVGGTSVPSFWGQGNVGVSVQGNVSANVFLGNGSQLTGLPAGYSNADVATYLASNSNVTITSTGNITTTANISGKVARGLCDFCSRRVYFPPLSADTFDCVYHLFRDCLFDCVCCLFLLSMGFLHSRQSSL